MATESSDHCGAVSIAEISTMSNEYDVPLGQLTLVDWLSPDIRSGNKRQENHFR